MLYLGLKSGDVNNPSLYSKKRNIYIYIYVNLRLIG